MFLYSIVMWDETWVHLSTAANKEAGMQRKHKFRESQNFRSLSVCWKGMWHVCLFWDVGVIYIKFMLREPERVRRHVATTA